MARTAPGFRMIELQASNFMRLQAIDITPTDGLVIVEGRNAQGKSSVLDAIFYALAGGNAQRGRPEIIRHGERKATVKVTLTDGTQTVLITRTWSKNNDPGTLKVTDENGTPYPSPRAMLDGLINEACFDPLAYANAPAKDQLAGLLAVVDLPFDPDQLAAERQGLFDRRTEAKRDLKRLDALVDSLPIPGPDVPDEEVSVAALAAQLAEANALELQHQQAGLVYTTAAAEVNRLKALLETARVDLDTATRAQAALPPLPDTALIAGQMATAEDVNAKVRARRQREATVLEARAAAKVADDLTAQLEAIDDRKAKALTEATMPLPGLGFDEHGVTYQGVPFSQASGAERLRVSAAMAIALNPTVRTMIVKDGPLLDDDGMALLAGIAEANNFQIIVERVWSAGQERTGVLIEDGQVADTAPTSPEPELAAVAVEPVADGGLLAWLDEVPS